jgi:hypothetical protein
VTKPKKKIKVQAPTSSDIESDVLDAIDARPKLKVASKLKAKRQKTSRGRSPKRSEK